MRFVKILLIGVISFILGICSKFLEITGFIVALILSLAFLIIAAGMVI